MSLLEIKNLHVNVGGNEILKGIDLTINPGEVHSIMGPNGSGKSTLAQVLSRREAYDVTEGEVLFNGKNLLEMKPEEAERGRVSGLPVSGGDSGHWQCVLSAQRSQRHSRPPR